jgi:hypothetical protein
MISNFLRRPTSDIGRCPISAARMPWRHHSRRIDITSPGAGTQVDFLAASISEPTLQYTLCNFVSMSDIQRYLLDYDKSKKDATATAQQSATRNYFPAFLRDGTRGVSNTD